MALGPLEVHHNKSFSGSLSFHRPFRTHGKLRAKCAPALLPALGRGMCHVNCAIVLTTGPVWNETGDIGSAITAEPDNAQHPCVRQTWKRRVGFHTWGAIHE